MAMIVLGEVHKLWSFSVAVIIRSFAAFSALRPTIFLSTFLSNTPFPYSETKVDRG